MHYKQCTPFPHVTIQRETPLRKPSLPITHQNRSFPTQRQQKRLLPPWARISMVGTIPRQAPQHPQFEKDDSYTIDILRHAVVHINGTPMSIGMVDRSLTPRAGLPRGPKVCFAFVGPKPTEWEA
jgi:hypothetical protein